MKLIETSLQSDITTIQHRELMPNETILLPSLISSHSWDKILADLNGREAFAVTERLSLIATVDRSKLPPMDQYRELAAPAQIRSYDKLELMMAAAGYIKTIFGLSMSDLGMDDWERNAFLYCHDRARVMEFNCMGVVMDIAKVTSAIPEAFRESQVNDDHWRIINNTLQGFKINTTANYLDFFQFILAVRQIMPQLFAQIDLVELLSTVPLPIWESNNGYGSSLTEHGLLQAVAYLMKLFGEEVYINADGYYSPQFSPISQAPNPLAQYV